MTQHDKLTAAENPAGAGVQALIDRLKSEGISAGQAEADALLANAEAKAHGIVARAEAEANAILTKARTEAEKEQAATRDSLQIAARDLVLNLRNELESRIQDEAGRLVSSTLSDEAFLQKLIITMAGKAREAAAIGAHDKIEISLPDRIVTFEELKQSPEAVEPGTLTHFAIALAGDVLRKGVTFSSAPGFDGIKIKVQDRDVSIDLTTEAIASLLTQHLQPRLRAIMEGVLR